jgi:hypothetical protein
VGLLVSQDVGEVLGRRTNSGQGTGSYLVAGCTKAMLAGKRSTASGLGLLGVDVHIVESLGGSDHRYETAYVPGGGVGGDGNDIAQTGERQQLQVNRLGLKPRGTRSVPSVEAIVIRTDRICQSFCTV